MKEIKTCSYLLTATLLSLLLLGCKSEPTYSSAKSDISAYNLIDPDEASKLIKESPGRYIPIQVSKKHPFLKEHLPTALNIWRPDYGSEETSPYGGLIPSHEKLENLLRRLGYTRGQTLLLYDIKANVDALRFAWVLNLYGFDDFKIINGGLKHWKAKGYLVNSDVTIAEESDYVLAGSLDSSMIAYFDDVAAAVSDTNTLLIDTRETYEYKGEPFVSKGVLHDNKKGAFDRGSIPSAVHLNWSELADLSGDHRIKAESDLRYNLEQKGIHPGKNIILYCQSGSRTSHMYYVLKHVLGYPQVKNYDGSWIEWSYKNSIDSTVPILKLCSDQRFEEMRDSLNQMLID